MKNISEILSEDSMEPGKIGSVIDQLKALPLAGREKTDLLVAWGHAVGAKISGSQFGAVYNSGIDNI